MFGFERTISQGKMPKNIFPKEGDVKIGRLLAVHLIFRMLGFGVGMISFSPHKDIPVLKKFITFAYLFTHIKYKEIYDAYMVRV